MSSVTIPKKLAKHGELVVIPKKEYDVFVEWKKTVGGFKTYIPTKAEKQDLKRAREDFKKGKYMTLNELKRKLGIKN